LLKLFCPNQVANSVLDIDLQQLYSKGITALILDLDNTLLGWDAIEVPNAMRAWVNAACELGFRICIASNSLQERVEGIAKQLGVPAIPKAIKPAKRPFRRALALLNVKPEETAVIGDQVFTDVLGGNRMGLYTILINPISDKELHYTRMVRHLERRILTRLQKKGMLLEGAVAQRQQSCHRQK
jgi:HAD superfamily phosphatase (TIGR01668 family)